ncbi:Protein prenyltransferase, alpha subunit [Kalmanozyma brasiliensis GHG001]|uniref:Geranylgeranyl transferase type-2 subunit alpha n=1 Tax=Kalmanozyma brasiliensis (strain GHG001) TaxID=1365824 RepID=V5EZU5_KALBG|nr:Protein prenyltransferase, alpha subunit [Kalmanozyma brasiliensis GHG001]EST08439.1 Protein prenyltransferase, alpha subunit [Kalmanozyma brasiliensis GHG001]
MHGVKRTPKSSTSAEARAARKAKEAAKLSAYLEIESTFFTYKRERRHDQTALEHTTKLLTLNPELYTVWNFRREVLLALFGGSAEGQVKKDVFADLRNPSQNQQGAKQPEEEDASRTHLRQNLLEDDLLLTEHALRAHPKVYWIWNHRMWCLSHHPSASVWERELSLVAKMLDLDPRNFHGWNCRRAIIQHLALSVLSSDPSTASFAARQPVFPTLLSDPLLQSHPAVKEGLLGLAERELAYTLRKIESNFSNFSAWHQRSKLLPHMWTARQLSTEQVDGEVDKELELVKQAMYTDPGDQSVWFYHRWLVEGLFEPMVHRTEGEGSRAKGEAATGEDGRVRVAKSEAGTTGGKSANAQPGQSQERRKSRQLTVLREEIGVIEELFELEPESKWCAISLAHYQMLLAGLQGDTKDSAEAKGKAKRLLEELIELDPDREQRYRDLLEGKAYF